MKRDYEVLRGLGGKLAEIAVLPVHKEKRALWTANNDLKPVRPLVLMDQLPWHELAKSDEMKLECEDAFLRSVEQSIREILYRWAHFPVDMVVENRLDVPKTVRNLDYGIHIREESLKEDPGNDIYSHKYEDQLRTIEDLDALKEDAVEADAALDQKHLEILNEIFKGLLPVRLSGVQIHAGIWDRIAQMRPAEHILWDLADDPDLIEATVKKFVQLSLATVDQCEALGLLDPALQYVHCTGAYVSDLPGDSFTGEKALAKDCWAFGMAQLFATVSPAMHDEYEIELVKPLYERFGLMYYGCCEPLHDRIHLIRKIKNVRKISISPWANIDIAAEQIGRDYVFSSKINPAFIANGFVKDDIVDQFSHVLRATQAHGTPAEFILKDVSTVGNRLERLDMWAELAMSLVGA